MKRRKPRAPAFAKLYEGAQDSQGHSLTVLQQLEKVKRILEASNKSEKPSIGTTRWYLLRINYQASELQKAVDRGDIEEIIEIAATIGMWLREYAIEHRHGGAIALREEQRTVLHGANEAKQREAKPNHARWQAEADEYWSRHPKRGKRAAAGEVVKKLGGNIDTVRRVIHKPK